MSKWLQFNQKEEEIPEEELTDLEPRFIIKFISREDAKMITFYLQNGLFWELIMQLVENRSKLENAILENI